ncbi:hypothetical protein [Mucisphaera sp.]|uniref:hypothetical protein n=1 Tax=Mucisphaera sp. TaxID=2913024 RepID=UPI003D0CC6E7
MPQFTILIGVILIVIGVVAYATAGGYQSQPTTPTAEQTPDATIPQTEIPAEAAELAPADATTETESSGPSITALIPAFIGAPILLAGLAGMNEPWRKHAMHAAMLFALLGTLGGLGMGLPKLPDLLAGDAERPKAIIVQLSMGVPCLLLMIVGIRSFIAARKARQALAATTSEAHHTEPPASS